MLHPDNTIKHFCLLMLITAPSRWSGIIFLTNMKLPLTQANYMLQSKRAMYGYVEIRPLDTFCPVINTVMKKRGDANTAFWL